MCRASPMRSPALSPAPSPRDFVGPRSPRPQKPASAVRVEQPTADVPVKRQARVARDDPERGVEEDADVEAREAKPQRVPSKRGSDASTKRRLVRAGSCMKDKKANVTNLLKQFETFAHGVHEGAEEDMEHLKQEMERCEALVHDIMKREREEREEAGSRLEQRCEALERSLAAVQEQNRREQAKEHDSTKQRIDHLETMFGAWADKHTRDVEMLRKANEALGGELAAFNDAHNQHLQVEESLDTAVQGLTSAAEQTAKALAAAKAKLDHMQEGVLQCDQHCAAAESKSAMLADRLKECERRLESSLGACNKELDFLKGEHGNLSLQVKQKFVETHDKIIHSAASHKANLDKHEENHGLLVTRHEGQARDLKALRDEHAKHGQDLGLLRRHVEGALGELAHNTAQELKATRDEVDQIMGLLAGVQRAWRPAGGGGGSRASRSALRKQRCSQEEAQSPKTPKTPKTPKAGYEVSLDLHGMEQGSRKQLL